MTAISADSHVVEGPGVFVGLEEKFGDEAPRVMSFDGDGDHIVIPARGATGVNVARMGLAATRLDRETPINRNFAHKPDVSALADEEVKAYFTGGYAAMRKGLTDGARRGDDQDIDGVALEFLYPG